MTCLSFPQAGQMNRSAFSQYSSGVAIWTNVCSKVFSSRLSEGKSFTQKLSNPARFSLANIHEKKKNYVGRNGLILAAGHSESSEGNHRPGRGLLRLNQLPQRTWHPMLSENWMENDEHITLFHRQTVFFIFRTL